MNNLKKYWAVAKVNFKTVRVAYLVTAFCLLAGIASVIMTVWFPLSDTTVSPSNYLYILCLLMPVFIASANYTKLMNIGVKKKVFLGGSAVNYTVLSVLVSLLCVAEYYLFDRYFPIYNLVSVFHWDANIVTAFFCSFSFLLLFQVIIHTLTFMQTKWYGWVADIAIVAIISVFTPIPALRQVEVFFFNMIIFAKPAIIQIAACLALSVGFYLTNLFYLKKRD